MDNSKYYKKFIEFLKKHNLYDEELYKYWWDNTIRFDYLNEDGRYFINTYYMFKDGYLVKISAVLPFIDSDITILINIHEYVHMFLLYKKIGKRCNIDKDCEVLPILFERIYIEENNTPDLNKYFDYINDCIITGSDEKYLLALDISNELLDYYNGQEIRKLDNKVKRLVLKHDIKKTFNI